MKKLLVILFLASPCFAAGPKYIGSNTDPLIQQEFGNVYQDLKSPTIDSGIASTMTVTYIRVSSLTINGVNYSAPAAALVTQYSGLSCTTTETATTSSSYVDATGISLSFTPKSATSHVLIRTIVGTRLVIGAANVLTSMALVITDGSNVTIKEWPGAYTWDGTGTSYNNPTATVVIAAYDAPGSTSAKTYKLRVKRDSTFSSGGTIQINSSIYGMISCIDATEFNQ